MREARLKLVPGDRVRVPKFDKVGRVVRTDFKKNTDDVPAPAAGGGPGGGFGRGPQGMNLRAFAEQRQKYLLNHAEVKKAGQ